MRLGHSPGLSHHLLVAGSRGFSRLPWGLGRLVGRRHDPRLSESFPLLDIEPISAAEFEGVLAHAANSAAPGPDNLPMELSTWLSSDARSQLLNFWTAWWLGPTPP